MNRLCRLACSGTRRSTTSGGTPFSSVRIANSCISLPRNSTELAGGPLNPLPGLEELPPAPCLCPEYDMPQRRVSSLVEDQPAIANAW
ncbi:hypothetical protein U9M48_011125 [Paspalum notatum var. saurae]|uniref:Uncharacterized protein n=1 Tax=Paspalum notatum var. saurae TaxID=547442 RepID=A0AAQ3SUK5_PASNO